MPKTIKEVYQDYTGYTTIEYSDDTTRKYSAADVATVVTDSNGKAVGIAGADGVAVALNGSRKVTDKNPFYSNPFIAHPKVVNPESITATLGPSVSSGGAITTEYNSLIAGKNEIAFRSDTDRATNGDLLMALSFGSVFPRAVAIYATQLGAYPLIGAGGLTGWNADGGITLQLDGDWIAFVYGDNTTTNTAEIYVDGKALSGSVNGVISNNIGSGSHSPQWVVLEFPDRRKRTITLVKYQFQAIVTKKDAQIAPAPLAGRAMVFGDSNSVRALTIGESTPIVRKNIAADALECLGYSVTNAGVGGTGFVADGGGYANGKANYSQVMDFYLNDPLYVPERYNTVWLFGTGNDIDVVTNPSQYATVIQKALTTYPNATIIVSGVYEGFSTADAAAAQNAILLAAVRSMGTSRVLWIPTDRANHPNGQAMWFGTGCVATPTGDGNADIYLGSVGSGAGDRHANALGCAHAANWLATEFVAAQLPYVRSGN